ncbi:MAG: undecaprenyl-phosphate glucose phosphotransferase [Gammaproteobacteria bacterium]
MMKMRTHRGLLHKYGDRFIALSALSDAAVIILTMPALLVWMDLPMRKDHWLTILLALSLFVVLAFFHTLYRSWRLLSIRYELLQVTSLWFTCVSVLSIFLAVTRNYIWIESFILAIWFLSTPLILILLRLTIRQLLHQIRLRGCNFRKVAIYEQNYLDINEAQEGHSTNTVDRIGTVSMSENVAHCLLENPWMGLQLVGVYGEEKTNRIGYLGPYLGQCPELLRDISLGTVDVVFITLPMRAQKSIQTLIDRLSETPVSIYYVPDVDTFDLFQARWENMGGLPILSLVYSPFTDGMSFVKRMEDVLLVLLMLLMLGLPMIAIAVAIKLTSPGPVFFRQERYGLDGKPFRIFKFRTMHQYVSNMRFQQATQQDPRVTSLGRFLRRTSLDELPQLINVLQGSMSVICPRPHPMVLDDAHRKRIRWYGVRHKVKPGITGLAQVSGFRGETDTLDKMENRIRCDLNYIKHWSLLLDLKILVKTLFISFTDRNAY